MRSMSGKTAIITGARTGIGLAILDTFASHGMNIWAIIHREDDLFDNHVERLQQDYNVWIKIIYADLSDMQSTSEGVKSILRERIPVDVLVNAAGVVGVNRLFQMTSLEEMRRVFDVNFFAPIHIMQLVTRQMARQKKGSVINIASIAGIDGDPAQMEYSASKAALICATKKLAYELGSNGIRVNAIAPGTTETKMIDAMTLEVKREMASKVALGRFGKPSEIADLCYYLASEESSYITGQTIRVDGGIMVNSR